MVCKITINSLKLNRFLWLLRQYEIEKKNQLIYRKTFFSSTIFFFLTFLTDMHLFNEDFFEIKIQCLRKNKSQQKCGTKSIEQRIIKKNSRKEKLSNTNECFSGKKVYLFTRTKFICFFRWQKSTNFHLHKNKCESNALVSILNAVFCRRFLFEIFKKTLKVISGSSWSIIKCTYRILIRFIRL